MSNALIAKNAASLVRIEMLRQGISRADLARRIGLSPGTIGNVLCGNSASSRARRKIEKALGASFWPAEETSSTRRQPQSV